MAKFKIRRLTCVMIFITLLQLSLLGCNDTEPEKESTLSAEMPLHLEEHLGVARIEGSEVPDDSIKAVEWSFEQPQPDWMPVATMNPDTRPVKVEHTDDALRLVLDESNNNPVKSPCGGIAIKLSGWNARDWGYVLVRARCSEGIQSLFIGFNSAAGEPATSRSPYPYESASRRANAISDGTVQTYKVQVGNSGAGGTWSRFGLWVTASRPATFEVLSISVIPIGADYAGSPVGVKVVDHNAKPRRTLYTHTPARLEYSVRVPDGGRLDVGLGVLLDTVPVTFDVAVTPENSETQSLLKETHSDPRMWVQRSVDLSHLAGQTVTLALAAEAERPGTVALWATPTLTGIRNTDKPNVILYIIDGAGAEYMSLYGHNRRTTPNLERLAAEGAVFEHAYSNCRWTQPSVRSFMTSLYHSVLGGFTLYSAPLPERAVTMAEHFHRAGYQTALFTGNELAGRVNSLDRGVDFVRDTDLYGHRGPSSIVLHKDFWQWRESFPGQPYWVHFQTIDVHMIGYAQLSPPFAGLYLSPAQRAEYLQWCPKVGGWPTLDRFEQTGVDRLEYYNRTQRLYCEAMAQQDHEIGRLVEQLKARGEWKNTLLVVASDHGQHESGLVRLDTYPPAGQHTHLRPEHTRIPMMFVWPGHIAGGQRFTQPVSMIDMLPTLLDLAGLPLPDVMQGQSLAPLLRGESGWKPKPVILDEFYHHPKTGELHGWIEAVDGRWGASLEVNSHVEIPWRKQPGGAGGRGEYADAEGERPAPLLLYDLWNDPFCMTPVNDEQPDLVEKYTKFLEAQWEAHKALAQHFTGSEALPLTPEQLRALRSLGYIQ